MAPLSVTTIIRRQLFLVLYDNAMNIQANNSIAVKPVYDYFVYDLRVQERLEKRNRSSMKIADCIWNKVGLGENRFIWDEQPR